MYPSEIIEKYSKELEPDSIDLLKQSADEVVRAKKHGKKVVVATGSGPNIHEGVTSLISELIRKKIIDGVLTSSAVVAHEMGGVLDKVKRINADLIGADHLDLKKMCRGNIFELSVLPDDIWKSISSEMVLDYDLIKKCKDNDGRIIIKAAGNMAYPMGLWIETVAGEIGDLSRNKGLPFEYVAGIGCDKRTMLGAGSEMNVPVMVTIPQLIGGGHVGISIGDSISVSERCSRIARILDSADVIIESAVALTQEIHDGPFETYTGHGIWADWMGYWTYSLKGKTLVRFDLDRNLKKAWDLEKQEGEVQRAIDDGLPKTKLTKIPFRMEMSAFSRLENSIPVVGDIGVIWPIFASMVALELGIELDFISHPQQTQEGKKMREEIVDNMRPIDINRIRNWSKQYKENN